MQGPPLLALNRYCLNFTSEFVVVLLAHFCSFFCFYVLIVRLICWFVLLIFVSAFR